MTPYVYAAGGKPKYPLHGHAADPTDHIHISYAKDLATADGLWTQNVSIPAKNAYAPLYKVGTRKADLCVLLLPDLHNSHHY